MEGTSLPSETRTTNPSKSDYPFAYARGDVEFQSQRKKEEPTSTHSEIKKQRRASKKSKTDLIYEKLQELDENTEVLDVVLPFRSLGKNSSLTNINELFKTSEDPQPPLTQKQAKSLYLDEDTAFAMTKQIHQMKHSMEKLQKIIQKTCNYKLEHDIDFIISNARAVIEKNEETRRS